MARRGPPAPQLIGTPRKRTISAGEVHHGTEGHRSTAGQRGRDHKSQALRRPAGWQDVATTKNRRRASFVLAEDLETVSLGVVVTAATLSGWRDAFLAAGEAALTTKPATGEEVASEPVESETRRRSDRARSVARKDRHPGGAPPFGPAGDPGHEPDHFARSAAGHTGWRRCAASGASPAPASIAIRLHRPRHHRHGADWPGRCPTMT